MLPFLCRRSKLPPVMRVAQPVFFMGIGEIRLPVAMYQHAARAVQDARFINRFLPALLMRILHRIAFVTRRMQPYPLAVYHYAGLAAMDYFGILYLFFQPCFVRF